MKNLIFKKFFLDNNNFFITIIFSLSLIVWIVQAVNYLDFVIEDGHGLEIYFKYTLLNLPKIVSKLIPIIFFIAIFYTINKYEDNNELKIFWISGIDKGKFIDEIIKYSSIFLIIQFFLSSFVVPFTQNKARTYIQKSNIDFFPSLINEKKFIDTVENLTIYIDKKDKDNEYKNIFLKDEEINKIKIIYANSGKLNNDENGRYLTLFNGKIIDINNDNISSFDFSSTTFDLSKYLTKSIIDFKIQEKNTRDLIICGINYHLLKKQSYYDRNNCNKDSEKMTKEELFKRMFKPLYFFSLGISVCFLITFSKESNKFKVGRFAVFLLGIIIIIFSEFSTSFSGESHKQFLISISLPIIIFLFQYILIKFKLNNFKKIK